MNHYPTHSPFPTTRWTLVVTLRNDRDGVAARDALSSLCNAYWGPLYCFARRQGLKMHDAKDVTQDFFNYAIKRELFAAADPELGQLRNFLITAFRRYMGGLRDQSQAAKRGGGEVVLMIDVKAAEDLFLQESDTTATPDKCFDRSWAHRVLERALGRLGEEELNKGRQALFRVLRPFLLLSDDSPAEGYAEIGLRLEMSPEAVGQAVKQLRKRFFRSIRQEVAETLRDPSKERVDEEIRSLKAALRL
jgi:RNA polymerase sigma factor (sigma-70 family)